MSCAVDPIDAVEVDRGAIASRPSCSEVVLPWGSGAGQIGLIDGGTERRARSAPALAVAPGGEILVLDAVNHRVVSLAAGSAPRTVIDNLAESASAMAIADDGVVAVFSPARATVWLYDRLGQPRGTLTLPGPLRHVVGVSFGPSHQLRFANAFQETVTAGSPALPLDLAAMLQSKVEGAFVLADQRGVLVEVTGDRAELVIVDTHRDGSAGPRFVIPGPASAAQIVGATGELACLRIEELRPGAVVVVERRAVCLDLTTGDTVYAAALPPPGAYRPRHELALGGDPPHLAWLSPRADGLAVASCEVSR